MKLAARLYAWLRETADRALGGKGSSVAEQIKNDILLTEYHQLSQQIPVLYLTVAITTIAGAVAAQGNFPFAYRIVAPLLIVVVCSARMIVWLRRQGRAVTVAEASQHLRGTNFTVIGLAGFAGLWSMLALY